MIIAIMTSRGELPAGLSLNKKISWREREAIKIRSYVCVKKLNRPKNYGARMKKCARREFFHFESPSWSS